MHAGAFCAGQLGEIEEATYNAMANTKRRLPHFLQFKDTEILVSLAVMSYNTTSTIKGKKNLAPNLKLSEYCLKNVF